MAKKNTNNKRQQVEVDYYDMMMSRFHSFLDSSSPQKLKGLTVFWGIMAVVLMVASSFPLPDNLRVLSALVGTPAGIILFFLGAGVIRQTSLKEKPIFNLRENCSHKKRLNLMFAIGGVFLLLMLFFVAYVPYGLGGALVVVGVLFAYYFLRKTDEERELDKLGLVDPRDYPEAYAEEDEDDDEGEYEEYEDDEYYDDEEEENPTGR